MVVKLKDINCFLDIYPIDYILATVLFVYDRGIRRNGGFKRLGQIRLNDDDDDDFNPIENDQIDVVVNKIVKGGVYTVAVLIATVKTIRKIDRMMLEKLGNVILEDHQVVEIMFLYLMILMKKKNCLVTIKIIWMMN